MPEEREDICCCTHTTFVKTGLSNWDRLSSSVIVLLKGFIKPLPSQGELTDCTFYFFTLCYLYLSDAFSNTSCPICFNLINDRKRIRTRRSAAL